MGKDRHLVGTGSTGGGRVGLMLLDGFRLAHGGQTISVPLSAQRVLVCVALRDLPVLRSFVAGSLWEDTGEERAHANLRSALWRLGCCGPDLVTPSGRHLALADSVSVDFRDAERFARTVLEDPAAPASCRGLRLLASDLLPDWYDEWVVLERERYRQLRLRALETLSERCLTAGRADAALEAGFAAVTADPLRESAHRAVIRVHIAEGNACEAIRQYELFQGILGRVGLEPSERMHELIGALHSAHADSEVG
jgi:DNA-binding SARP family transcriptional activator